MSKPSPAAILIERSKNDIPKVRVLATLSVLFHLMTSTTMLVMAFYKSQKFGTDFSTTLVLCAFGGLIAALWSSVAAFEILSTPLVKGHRTLPKWEWHNRHFNLAVGVVFLDTFCLLPACFLFVLHSQGQDVFVILHQLKLTSSYLGIVVIHLMIAVLLGIVQVLNITHATRQLHLRQHTLEAQTSTTLSLTSKVLIASKMVFDLIFLIMLIVIAVGSDGNSGPIICVISAFLTRCVFVLLLMERSKGLNTEAFLTRWRQACILQCFLTYGEFWISFIVYLLRKQYQMDFFSIVNNMPGPQRGLVAVALTGMLMTIINYVCLLYCHARCMAALDEIGGLSRLEGVDSVANLYGTGRATRVTAVEMASTSEQKDL